MYGTALRLAERGLFIPPLGTMTDPWRLRTVERRALGDDRRLLLRPEISSIVGLGCDEPVR